VSWLVALAVLAFWGFGYLDRRGGGFDPKVYEPFPSAEYVASVPPPEAGDAMFDLGARLYKEKGCVGCHQVNGAGSPAQNWPPLAGSDWVNAEGPNRIIRIVLHGLTGPVEVSGKVFNGATMTPMGSAFSSDDEIAAVLTYVRGNEDWGNNASPVSAEQVKAARAATQDRPITVPWTAEELKAIPVKD
jgi:mono/diheme cytochrome c family protein